MSRNDSPRFSSALIPFVLGYVRACGKDPQALGRKVLPKGASDAGSAPTLDAAGFRTLMEGAARLVEDPLFGVRLAQAMPRGSYGLLEFAIRSAPTARAALEQLVRYGALINPAVRFWLEPAEDEVAIHHRLPADPEGVGRHGNLFTVARLLTIGREMVGPELNPRRVWFAHPEREAPAALVELLRTDRIEFGRSSNGLSFDAAALERPLEGADPELNSVLREHANRLLAEVDPAGIHERARKAVLALLPQGEVSLGAVAKKLHLSERTLQRRLTEDGVSFAALVVEVRSEAARRLLVEKGLPVAEVAQRLGYQDGPAFARAFKRWTGKTPAAFRSAALR